MGLLDGRVVIVTGAVPETSSALQSAFGIKTIADLATSKYVIWAQAINALSS